MRDQLVNAQVKRGDDAGRWGTEYAWGSQGGRLYTKCLYFMTLEVYYRHLPLYRPQILSLEEVPEATD